MKRLIIILIMLLLTSFLLMGKIDKRGETVTGFPLYNKSPVLQQQKNFQAFLEKMSFK